MARRTISIASSPGWSARFEPADPLDDPRTVVLACWALTEDGKGGATAVVGLVQRPGTPESPHGNLAPADEVEGFEGYTFTGLSTKDF